MRGSSNDKPHDAGFDVSFDQHVSEHLIPFFRAGIGEGNINGIDDMISGGVGWQETHHRVGCRDRPGRGVGSAVES